MAPTTAEAVAAGGPFLEAKYGAYRQLGAGQGAARTTIEWGDAFDDLARDRFLLGDPVRVREELARYRELGVTTLVVRDSGRACRRRRCYARSACSESRYCRVS